jgi:hypothetical protein
LFPKPQQQCSRNPTTEPLASFFVSAHKKGKTPPPWVDQLEREFSNRVPKIDKLFDVERLHVWPSTINRPKLFETLRIIAPKPVRDSVPVTFRPRYSADELKSFDLRRLPPDRSINQASKST